MASDASVRLFIGGLPGDITSKQLAGRFASFGSTSAVELVPRKHSPADGCRGFAYVDFTPNDDQALHRCLSLVRKVCLTSHSFSLDSASSCITKKSCNHVDVTSVLQYNGCKWRGGVLRVEKAKVHYLNRLQTEWEAKPESHDESQDAACIQESSLQEDPMRIPTPASGFVKRKVSLWPGLLTWQCRIKVKGACAAQLS